MAEQWADVQKIFDEALKRKTEERAAFLNEACGDDAELRAEVESLLKHHLEASTGFMQPPDPKAAVTVPLREPPPDPLIGSHIGHFHIKRLIAAGGMGKVYLAQQEHPRRTVALKIMKPGIASSSALRRFEYESQILARLRHPGIAQVYEAGTHDEGSGAVPYFAMEYIPNAKPITEHADQKKLGTKERLELFARVCDAVHHGHQKGIIHRDLKPGNILVDSGGQPKVIDFGVARATDSDMAVTTLQTDLGQLIGTLQYMSPEQCDADPHDLDTRSDVYALGVVLYELLCGRLPYDLTQLAMLEAARVIREESPSRLSTNNRSLRGDVETISLMALEKDRDRRYRSAAELGDDIRRYLKNEPIDARPPSMTYQIRMFARRNRTIFAAAVIVLASLLLGIIGTSAGMVWATREAHNARQAETAERKASQRATDEAERAQLLELNAVRRRDYANLASAESAIRQHDITTAKQHLEDVSSERRGWTWRHLQSRLDDSLDVLIPPTGVHQNAVGWSSDGRMIASGGADGLVKLVSLSGELISSRQYLPKEAWGTIYDLVFRPDGRRLAVAGSIQEPDGQRRGMVKIWDVSDPYEPNLIASFRAHYRSVSTIAFHPRTPLLATASTGDESIILWDVAKPSEPKRIKTLTDHDWMVRSVAFNGTGDLLASASYDMTARVWNVSDPAHAHEVLTLRSHSYYVVDVAFRPNDDNVLATASIDGTIKLWDVAASRKEKKDRGEDATGVVIDTLRGHTAGLTSIAFSHDGRLLASASADRSIRIWELDDEWRIWDVPERNRSWKLQRRRELTLLHSHSSRIRSLAFGPEDQLVSASDDGTVRLWATEPLEAVPTLLGHTSSVMSVAVGQTKVGVIVASGGGDFTVRLWDPERCEGIATLIGHGNEVDTLAFDPKGNRIASGSRDKTVIIWDVTDPGHTKRIATLSGPIGHQDVIWSVAFDPLGERLASASEDGTVKLWDLSLLENSTPVTLYRGSVRVNVVRFNSSGKLIVTGHGKRSAAASIADDSARIWNAATNELLYVLQHDSPVTAAAFSPDDQILVTGTQSGQFTIWDMANGRTPSSQRSVSGHGDSIYSVEFHPNIVGTKWFATCSADRTIRLWEIAGDGIPMVTLRGHIGTVRGLAFSPDGSFLASASGGFRGTDNSVKLWETEIDREVKIARAKAIAARREAKPIVEERFQQHVSADEVVASLESDAELRAETRDAAVRLARFRGDYPYYLLRDSWRVVKKDGATQDEYRQALERALLALRNLDVSRPHRGLYLLALGVAQYRVGTPEHLHMALGALKEAERALEQGPAKYDPSLYLKRPSAAAAVAMVHWRLEQTAPAWEALRRARDLIPDGLKNYPDTDSVALLREAQALIEDSVGPTQE